MGEKLASSNVRQASFKPHRTVLIIGGYGEVGRHIAAHFHKSDEDIQITIAGRILKKARIAARRWDERVRGVAVDAEDRAAVEIAVQNASLVVLNTETGTDTVVQACIQNSVPMITVAASHSVLRTLMALNRTAEEYGVALVRDVGLAPGLINMLADYAVDRIPEPELVEFFVELGLISRHGQEAISWTLARVAETHGATKIRHLDRVIDAIPVDFIDRPGMSARLGIPQVKSFFVPVPRWTAGWLIRLAPVLQRHTNLVRKVTTSFASALSILRLPNDQLGLHVRTTSSSTCSVVSLRGRNQSKVTGVLAAETALAILRGGGRPGVSTMSDVLAIRSLCRLFDSLGFVFEETSRYAR